MNLFDKLPLFLRPPYPIARRVYRFSTLAALLLAVVVAYLFFVTAGTFDEWPTYNGIYEQLAAGFQKKHLYLLLEPAPQLLAAKDPLDPVNTEFWLADFTLYKGKYYVYWGPFPALAILAARAIFKINKSIGDQYPCFAFYLIYVVAGAMLIRRMGRRLFPGVPHYFVLMAIAVFAFANPTPYLIATPGIYEAAIGGCQAFLLVGLVLAFDALGGLRRFSNLRLLAAGVAWSMAIACRVSAGPAVLLLVLLTGLVPHRGGRRWLSALVDVVWMSAPIVLTVAGLLVYNKLRFDSWLEFGTGYQLNTMHYRPSTDYVAPNLYSYFLRWPVLSCQYPFATAPWDLGPPAFPRDYQIPDGYSVQEPVVGMFRVVPWTWFVLLGLVFAAREVLPRSMARPLPSAGAVTGASLWCTGAFAILGIVTGLPFVPTFGATMRYLGDVTAGFILFATWGTWGFYQLMARRKWLRRGYGALLTLVAAATIALGVLFGFQGYADHFRLYNPALYEKLSAKLSRCK